MDTLLAIETLSEIIKYLKNDQKSLLQLSQTCKKLYELTIPYLYKSPQFTTFNSFETFANSLSIINGNFVRHIDLHMVPHRWDSSKITNLLCQITEKSPDLELLNLDLCSQLSNKALKRIIKPLHDLRVLSLDQCVSISDEAIEFLVLHCPYIQELYLGATHITNRSLELIATKLILLTHLFIPGCESISEHGINTLTRESKTLKYIDIKDCYNVVGHVNIPFPLDSTANEEEDAWEDTDDDDSD